MMDRKRRRVLQGFMAGGVSQIVGCDFGGEVEIELDEGATMEDGSQKMLILGGTGFIGPHVVRAAIAAGFEVTLFNRGRSNADLFPDLELLVGDRNGDLDSIARAISSGRRWQAVIDLSGYGARQVRDTAQLLDQAADRYVFISSVAAYASFDQPNDETSPTHTSRRDQYGPQKAQAEREAETAMPGRVTSIRPTYVAGPGDNTDRFTYWPVRVSRGGVMIAPGPVDRPIQFIDVRDLAGFTIHCAAAPRVGVFNATIPPGSYTMEGLIDDCRAVAGSDTEVVWVSPEFVAEHSMSDDNGTPIWDSPIGAQPAFPLTSSERAQGQGLKIRSPIETVRDTLEWWRSLAPARQSNLRAGLSGERERTLLAEWRRIA